MKKQAQTFLPADPRYPAFVERYAFDLARFAFEVCGDMPTNQQVELYQNTQKFGCRVSVASGHGTGKTRSFSVIAIWHLLCYHNKSGGSNTFITAPRIATVKDGIWKEFADIKTRIGQGEFSWLNDYFEVEHEKVYVKGYKLNWWIQGKTAPKGSPENLAGAHRDFLLWICDESSGIPDGNFGVIGGSLTDPRNRMICASQPTRSSGFFYDQHHRLSSVNGGVWTALTFNSEDSSLVSTNFLREKLLEYGGRDSIEYQIKVLGKFPDKTDGMLLGRSDVEKCFDLPSCIGDGDEWGWIAAIDVGAGEYRDKSVMTLAKVSGYGETGDNPRRVHVVGIPVLTNTKNIRDFAGECVAFLLENGLSNITRMVDEGGFGRSVCLNMEEGGSGNLIRVNWGYPCFRNENRDRYVSMRAQASVACARAAKEGRLTIANGHYKTEALDQASRIPYHFDDKTRYVIEKKEEMRKQGIHSPDIWDTVCFLFLEGAYYTVSNESVDMPQISRSETVANLAEEMLRKLGI